MNKHIYRTPAPGRLRRIQLCIANAFRSFYNEKGKRHLIHSKRKEAAMFKVSVMYPNQENARFDIEYYRTKHLDLVTRHLQPFGLVRTEVLKGISGGAGQPAPYICIGNLYFETADGYDNGIAASGGALRADIANFTNMAPVRQISEILT